MEAKDIIKKVRKIEIKTRGLSSQIFSGEYHSAFKGMGMSFSEVREYDYGDDIRHIDWNVTARTGDPYIKVFEEERELNVMLLIDVSASSFFGSNDTFKNEFITEIAAVLAFSAVLNNDKVGAILFSDKVEMFIPPKKGKQNILRIIRELLHIQPNEQGTNLSSALRYLNNISKKRTITFILSDFFTTDYEQALSIVAKRHDIIGVKITDKLEVNLPNAGLIRVKDAETGDIRLLDTSNASIRKSWNEYFKKYDDEFRTVLGKNNCDILPIYTDDDYIKALRIFFKKRARN